MTARLQPAFSCLLWCRHNPNPMLVTVYRETDQWFEIARRNDENWEAPIHFERLSKSEWGRERPWQAASPPPPVYDQADDDLVTAIRGYRLLPTP